MLAAYVGICHCLTNYSDSAAAGLHQTYIGLLERGKRSPNLDTAQAIAKSLGLSLSRMILEAEKKQARKR